MGEFNQAAAGEKKNPRRVIDFYELGVKKSINYSQGNRDGRFLGHFSTAQNYEFRSFGQTVPQLSL